MIQRFKSLSRGKKASLVAGILVLLSFIAPTPEKVNKNQILGENNSKQATQVIDTSVKQPIVLTETKIETITESIPFEVTTRNDSTLEKGKSKKSMSGQQGERTITFEVNYRDGVETSRKQVSSSITRAPVNEMTLIGIKVAVKYVAPTPQASSSCDSNYSACVPIASDVDCAGGNGNGPAYVSGPVSVIGYDIYDLDRDSDGIGCE